MRLVLAVLLAMFFVSVLAPHPAAAAPPGVQLPSSGVPIPKPPTGFDIAVTDIGTTGPLGTIKNCPIITIKNVGTKAVNGYYKLAYKRNGVLIFTTPIAVLLAPGQTLKTGDNPVNASFAQYGDTVEATIDEDDKLREDNEANNTLTKKLLLLVPA